MNPSSAVFSDLQDATELVLEIHGGEGGEDSKLWVHDLFSAYVRYAESHNLKVEILDSVHGHVVARIKGKNVWKWFRHETGTQVVQRIPPTEKKERRQTSMISVAVLPMPPDNEVEKLPEPEIEIQTQVGSGPGGQHRNRTESAVRAIHKPTGTTVWIDGRNQHQNRAEAIRILTAKVNDERMIKENEEYAKFRREVMGNGGRGSKVRTYNFINNRVTDHRLKKKTTKIKQVMKGEFEHILE